MKARWRRRCGRDIWPARRVDTFAQEPPKNSPLIGLPNLIATPHIAGSTAEAQEEVGTLIAQQVRDYLAEGLIRNAVNMPALSAEQYRRLRPYLELGERLGSFRRASRGFGEFQRASAFATRASRPSWVRT